MTNYILALVTPAFFEVLIVLLVLALPIALIVLVVIYVSRGSKERKKLHLKVDELANELKQTQEQLKKERKGES